ncbi:substrate-binding periplasmic protein [Spartinivicinus ruber]|uniref:substrate-binding periplasmic protein n=1 Tax=Spartinivicinus ruber TaxID=2683272 RepID=UPI0013CFF42A|nr:transporter substrate-binding domain-containing protein [Spartinivicinus ruber]
MMKRLYSTVLVLFSCVLFNIEASELYSTVRFGFTANDFPPYVMPSQKKNKGIMFDILKVVMNDLGYKVEIKTLPRKRIHQFLDKGRLDIIATAKEWMEDSNDYHFTNTIVSVNDVLWYLSENLLLYNEPKDLLGKNIATHRGYNYPTLEPYFEEKAIGRMEVDSDLKVLKMILNKRVDSGIVADRTGEWLAKKYQFKNKIKYSRKHISSYNYRFAFHKNSKISALFDEVDKKINDLKSSQRYENILNKYL